MLRKRHLLWVPLLLMLDALALHDIMAGEPGVWMEWTVLAFSLAAYGLLLLAWLQTRRSRRAAD